MMKKFLALALSGVMALSLAACGDSTSNSSTQGTGSVAAELNGNVKTGGSTSVEKVMTALIYKFQESNQNVTIDYEMNGSGDGIKGVASGKYEIGHASRSLKDEETAQGLEGTSYAIDGIALVVNKNNAAAELTQAQVKDIYTGKIKNWKEVGGKDAPITVVVRESVPVRAALLVKLWELRMKIWLQVLPNVRIPERCKQPFPKTQMQSAICPFPTWIPVLSPL